MGLWRHKLQYLTRPDTTPGETQRGRRPFELEYAVQVSIQATPAQIWKLLTTADEYTQWNQTVISVEGQISSAGKFTLVSKLAPKQPFHLHVSCFEPCQKMSWRSGQAPFFSGQRTYTLLQESEQVLFTMREVFQGILLPVMALILPDFRENFAQFAQDLKQTAEA